MHYKGKKKEKKNKNPLQKQSTLLLLQVSPWGEEEGTREREKVNEPHVTDVSHTI